MLLTGPFGGLADDVREFPVDLAGFARRFRVLVAAAMSGPEPPLSLRRHQRARSRHGGPGPSGR